MKNIDVQGFHVGQEFIYLGKRLRVVSTSFWSPLGWHPRLTCDYVDDTGKIHRVWFDPEAAESMRGYNEKEE